MGGRDDGGVGILASGVIDREPDENAQHNCGEYQRYRREQPDHPAPPTVSHDQQPSNSGAAPQMHARGKAGTAPPHRDTNGPGI